MKFYSLYVGYLLELFIWEGEYVDVGLLIVKIVDLSVLWLEM